MFDAAAAATAVTVAKTATADAATDTHDAASSQSLADAAGKAATDTTSTAASTSTPSTPASTGTAASAASATTPAAKTTDSIATTTAVAGATKDSTSTLTQVSTAETLAVTPAPRSIDNVHQVVVVDTSVADYQTLIAGIDPSVPVILLGPGQRTVAGIAEALLPYKNLDSVVLVSEGGDGGLILDGTNVLTDPKLASSADDLASIGASLKTGGDFLLLGCSIAADDMGKQLVDDFAHYLGNDVDVAASTDPTGPAALGGDWVLEYDTGAPSDTALPFTTAGMNDFDHVLVNTAPVLDASQSPALNSEVSTSTSLPSGAGLGTLVSSLVSLSGGIANVTDPDSGAVTGIAITATDTAHGNVWYTINNGVSWTNIGTLGSNALLLAADANTRIYLAPSSSSFTGAVSDVITFRAWDMTSGTAGTKVTTATNGGSSAFSSATDTASINITGPNAAPVITNLSGDSVAWAGVSGAVTLDAGSDVVVHDTENDAANWNGGSLTLQRVTSGTADGSATDVYGFGALASTGTIVKGTDSSGTVTVNGKVLNWTYTSASGLLSISFGTAGAASADVQALMSAIQYSDATPYGNTTIRFALNDGSGNTTNADVAVTSSTIYVDNTSDVASGAAANGFSLREALAKGVAQSGADTIVLDNLAASTTLTLSGSTATLGAGDTISDSGKTLTIAAGTGGGLVLAAGTDTISVSNAGALTISAVISGTGTLTKSGTAGLTLTGTNTYTGATDFAGGTLSTATLGSTSSLIFDGGTFKATALLSSSLGITVNAGGGTIDNSTGSIQVGLFGAITGTGALTLNAGATSNVLKLSGNNTFSGGVIETSGLLDISSNTALGTGTLTINGGKIRSTAASAVSLSNGLVLNTDLIMTGSVGISFAGAVDLGGGNRSLNDGLPTGADLTLSGVVSHGNLIVASQGTAKVVLSGTANTYTNTTVTSGILSIAGAGSLGSGTVSVGGGTLLIAGAATIAKNIAISGASTIQVASGFAATLSGAITGSTGSLALTSGSGTTDSLTLSGADAFSGTVTVSTGTKLILGANESFGGLAGAGNINLASFTLTVSNTTANSYSGVLSGTGGLTKAGSGTLTLSGTSTYTGATTINAGGISVSGGTLGSNSAVTVASGATLTLSAAQTIGSLAGAGTVTMTGALTVGSDNTSTTFSGVIQDGSSAASLVKNGTGTLTLSGASTFTGATTINAGTLQANSSGALGTATGATTVASGASLSLGSGITIADAISVAGSGASNLGALILSSGNATVSGTVTLTAAISVSVGDTSTLTLSGTLGGAFSFGRTIGNGTVVLSGTNTSSTTSLSIIQGSLQVTDATNLTGGTLTLDMGDTTAAGLVVTGSNVTIAKNIILGFSGGRITNANAVTLSGVISSSSPTSSDVALTKLGAGTLTLSGTNTYSATGATNTTTISAGTLSITGGTNLGSGTGAVKLGGGALMVTGTGTVANNIIMTVDSTISATNTTGSVTLSGVISGAHNLTSAGLGTLIFSGTNTYSGTTTVTGGGTLSIAAASNISSGAISLNSGTLAVTGTGITLSQGITLGPAGGTISSANTLTLSGVISGTGNLTTAGGSTLTLSGTNTYSGSTTISAGTLATSGGSAIGDSSAVTVASGATLSLGANETIGSLAGAGNVNLSSFTLTSGGNNTQTSYSGVISGTGGFTKTGTGLMIVSGASTYTGATAINGGTLAAFGGTVGSNSAVTVAAGATFDVLAAQTIGSLTGAGIVIFDGATLTTGGDNTSTGFTGLMSGIGGLTKAGSGTFTLSSANTYSGATTINAGTLQASSSSALGTAAGGTTVASGASLSLGSGVTIADAISVAGSGASNLGALILSSGNATLSGNVTLTASISVSVGDTSTLTLSGTLGGAFSFGRTIGNGTVVLSGSNASSTTNLNIIQGSLQVTNGTNLTGGTLTLDMGDTTAAGLVVTGSNVTIANNIVLGFSGGRITNANAVTLSGVISSSSPTSSDVALTKLGAGTLTLSGTNTYSATGATNTTTISAGTLSITNGGNLGTGAVKLGGGALQVTGTGVTVTNNIILTAASTISATNTATLSGVISGAFNLTSAGAGTLILSGTNTYSGTTTVTAGTLSIAAASNISSGAITLNGGTLAVTGTGITLSQGITLGPSGGTVSSANTLTLSGVVGGTGNLTTAGGGTVTLSGTNTYSGSTTISAGTLATSGGSAIGDSSAVTIASGATLSLGANETIGSVSGAGNVTLGSSTLTVSGNTAVPTYTGVISGTGGLTKNGTALMSMTGASTYTGATTINAGILSVAGGTLGSNSAVTVGSAGTLVTFVAESIGSLAGSGSVVLGGTNLTIGGDNTSTTFSGVIQNGSGTGSLTKTGTGTLTLSGANTYTGTTTISAGTLVAGNSNALGSPIGGTTVSSGATLQLAAGVTIADALSIAGVGDGNNGALLLNSGSSTVSGSVTLTADARVNVATGATLTVSGAVSGSATLDKQGNGTLTLSGTNSGAATNINLGSGSLSIAGQGNLTTGTLTLNEASTGSLVVTGSTVTLTSDITLGTNGGQISNANAVTLSGVISGTGPLTKLDVGTLTLSGAETYTGATTVSAGTMNVTGALGATSGVTVASGGTLGGTGSIFAASSSNTLTVASGGTLSPGVGGVGTLTVNGNVTIAGTFAVDIASTTSFDQLVVSGLVNVTGATLAVTNGYAPTNPDSYTIISNTGGSAITGTFSGAAEGATVIAGGQAQALIASYVGGVGAPNNNFQLTVPQPAVSGTHKSLLHTGDTTATPFSGVNFIDQTSGAASYSIDITLSANNGSFAAAVGLSSSDSTHYTLTASDRVTLQARLQALVFTPVGPFGTGTTFTLNPYDANNPHGTPDSSTVVALVNAAPTLTTTTSTPTFTEGGFGVHLFSGTTISAVEGDQNIQSLTLTLSGWVDGSQESIIIDNAVISLDGNTSTVTVFGNSYLVTMAYAGSTVTFTVTNPAAGSFTIAQAQALVDNLGYYRIGFDPTAGNRIITLTAIQDTGGTANGGQDTTTLNIASTVTVVPVNTAPSLATGVDTAHKNYTEGGTAAHPFSTATFTNEAGQNILNMTMTVSAVADGANDILNIDGTDVALTNANSVTTTNGYTAAVSLSGTTATILITLGSGGVSSTTAGSVITGLTYRDTSRDPSGTTHQIRITQVQDNGGTANGGADTTNFTTDNAQMLVTLVNDAPTLTTTPVTSATYRTGGAAAALFGSTAISAVEASQSIQSLTLTVGNLQDGASEILSVDGTDVALTNGNSVTTIANGYGVAVSLASGTATVTITKTGNFSTTAAQTLVNGLGYKDTSTTPTLTGGRTVTLTSIQDSGGTANGGVDTTSLSVASSVTLVVVNNAPTLTTTPSTPSFIEGGAAASLFSGTAVGTADLGQNVHALTLTVAGVADGSSETLQVDGTNVALTNGNLVTTSANGYSVAVSLASGTATVTITNPGDFTTTQAQALVNGLSYLNTSHDPTVGSSRTVTLTSIQDTGGTANGGVDTTNLTSAATVTLVPVNDAPTLTTTISTPSFTEGGTAVPLFSSTAIGTVEAGQSIQSLQLTVGNVANGASETLTVDGSAVALTNGNALTTTANGYGVAVSLASGTATVTITKTGNFSTTAAQTLVNGLTYQDTTNDPTVTGGRTVTLTSIQDTGGTANGGVDTATLTSATTVTIVAVDNAPTLSVPGVQTISDSLGHAVTGISIADVDADGGTETVTLGVTKGNLSLTASGSASVSGNNSGSVTLSGTVADVNATLASLTYASTSTTVGADTLSVSVSDNSNTGTGGPLSASNTVTINLATNDTPVVSVPGAQSFNDTSSHAITGVSISDTTQGNVTTATVSDLTGNLAFTASGGASIGGNNSNSVTITGSLADVNATLASLAYTTTLTGAGSDTITVAFDDGGTILIGGAKTGSNTIAVALTGNDTPVVNVAGAQAFNDTNAHAITGVSIGDTLHGGTVTATVSDLAGNLSFTASGSANVANGGTGNVTITGSLADVNATLASLSYATTATATGSDTITVAVDDGGTGLIGGNKTASNTIGVALTGNDTPVVSVAGAQSFNDTNGHAITGVSIADALQGSTVTATVSDLAGNLSFTTGGSANVANNGTGTVTITGSLADVNTTLASLTYATIATSTGSDTITVAVNDGGTARIGGAKTASNTITVTLTGNDTPVVSVASAQSFSDTNAHAISGVSIADTTHGNTVSATVSDLAGNLGFTASGAASVTGNNSGSVTITGSLADVNATLASLNYTTTATATGSDTITVGFNDNGTSLVGGAKSASNTIAVALTGNDTPVVNVAASQSFSDTNAHAISGVSIADTAHGNTVRATVSDLAGNLGFTASGAATVTGNNSGSVTITGSLADVNATLASLIYTTTATATGSDTITVGFNDNGTSLIGGAKSPSNTIAVALSGNDTPVVNLTGAQSIADINAHAISGVSVADTLSGSAVTVTISDTTGSLNVTASGAAHVTLGNTIPITGIFIANNNLVTVTGSVADVNATLATLTYAAPIFSGSTDTITVAVNDGGSNRIGGAKSANGTIAVALTGNDTPVLTLPATQRFQQAPNHAISGISVADILSGSAISVTVADGQGGKLSLNASGAATVTGNGSANVTISGSLADVNATLASLAETPAASGTDQLTVTVNDGGTNRIGGIRSAVGLVTLNVDAIPTPVAPVSTPATTNTLTVAPVVTATNSLVVTQAINDIAASTPNGFASSTTQTQTAGTGSAGVSGTPNAGLGADTPISNALGVIVPANGITGILPPVLVPTNTAILTPSDTTSFVTFSTAVGSTAIGLTVGSQISDQTIGSGQTMAFQLPQSTFLSSDPQVTVEAKQSDGQPLPAWLKFDASKGTFSGQPPAGATGSISITISARDSKGDTATTRFQVTVGGRQGAELLPSDLAPDVGHDAGLVQPAAFDMLAMPAKTHGKDAAHHRPAGKPSLSAQLQAASTHHGIVDDGLALLAGLLDAFNGTTAHPSATNIPQSNA